MSRVKLMPALLSVLVLIALAGVAYSVYSWRQNRNLNSELASQKTQVTVQKSQIANLSKKVDSLNSKINDSKSSSNTTPASTQPITGEVGAAVSTKSGDITLNTYNRNSLHGILFCVDGGSSNVANNLIINLTLKNTSDITQTYTPDQFTFVDSSSQVLSNMNRSLIDESGCGTGEVYMGNSNSTALNSITLEPGGSITTNVYFANYDAKAGTLKWVNLAGQEIRIPIGHL